jgi:hypothetical protein
MADEQEFVPEPTNVDLQAQFNLRSAELLALRERKQAGEELSAGEYATLGLYRDLLNAFVQQQRIADRKANNEANKEAVAAARDLAELNNAATLEKFAGIEAEFNALYRDKPDLFPPEDEIKAPPPEKPVETVVEFDPSNPQKTVQDIQNAGKDVEEGTKKTDFTRQEGVFNEFSSSTDLIESLKSTVAQTTEKSANIGETSAVFQNDGGIVQSSGIESLKDKVSQLIDENERLIDRPVQLDIFSSGFYANDIETNIRALGIKQNTLDPATVLFRTESNQYSVPFQLVAAQSVQLVTEAELAQIAAQESYEDSTATYTDYFSGGG